MKHYKPDECQDKEQSKEQRGQLLRDNYYLEGLPENSKTLVAEMLLREPEVRASLDCISAYFVSDYNLHKPSSLIDFLDVYHGVIKTECELCSLLVEGIDFSVYEPKALRPVRYIIKIIHNCVKDIGGCLDKLTGTINDDQMRELLVEYIHAYAEVFSGQRSVLSKLAADCTLDLFKKAIREYTPNNELPLYYVAKVLGYQKIPPTVAKLNN
ncbi:MAG: hypothetical protein L3V56_01955 [Candidatus Magnetoovum sp. WYHC-5]|nr:hypothetical protein [Candidatus Magnetoovum sp. WYHC-5]